MILDRRICQTFYQLLTYLPFRHIFFSFIFWSYCKHSYSQMLLNKRVFLSEPDKVLSLSFKQQMFVYVIGRQSELNLLRFRMPKLPSPRDYDDFEGDNALRIPFIIACCTLILFLLIKIIKEWCGGGAPMQLQIVLQDDRTVQNARIVQKKKHTDKVWVICIFNLIL